MTITNEDNMKLMARYEDNYFDLAIVDPPYGLGDRLVKGGFKGGMGTMKNLADDKVTTWDDEIPTPEYFKELKRVSKNHIIWGGNYFLDYLGKTDGFIVWDKMNGTTRMFRWHHFSGERITKIHPTQKPVKLYEWLLINFAKQGDKILDTHLGSGSIAIACHNLGYDLTACELDTEYYNAAIKRIEQHKQQLRIF
tara:strand:+ start:238 stop:822 length:585 start_codon:yes stop_codon:yes gene_type:complete